MYYGRVSEFDLGSSFGATTSDYALGVYIVKLFANVANLNGADVLGSFKAYLGKDADTIIASIGAAGHQLDMGVMQEKIGNWIRSGHTPMALTLPDVRSVMMDAASSRPSATKVLVSEIFDDLYSISKTGVEASKAVATTSTELVKGLGATAKYLPFILLGAALLIGWKIYNDSKRMSQ